MAQATTRTARKSVVLLERSDQLNTLVRSLAGYKVMAVTTEVGPAGTVAPTQQPELYGNLA